MTLAPGSKLSCRSIEITPAVVGTPIIAPAVSCALEIKPAVDGTPITAPTVTAEGFLIFPYAHNHREQAA